MTKSWHLNFIIIAGFALIIYLPLLIKPEIIFSRGNDLQEQFWPVFYFIKNQILQNHSLPLWNNLFLAGLPLLPDPQFSLFYPPNMFFLLFPINLGFLISFFFHILLGGMGMYWLTKRGLGFSYPASLFTSFLYITTPKLAGYLEAGHFGLVATLAWFPWLVLALIMLLKKSEMSWSILLAISLAGLFYTHTVTFFIALVIIIIFFCITLFTTKPVKTWFNALKFFALGNILAFGLSAVALLPQLEWMPQTTRLLLLDDRDVYPKWTSVKEFIQAIFWPVTGDSEKWLVLGISSILLACYGFWQLKRKFKIIFSLLGVLVVLIASNNASPFYNFLLSQDWYVLTRVATRVWFIPMLAVTILAGLGFNWLIANGVSKKYLIIIGITLLSESASLFWIHLSKPIPPQDRLAPADVYQFLKQDQQRFRVFCLNRCLSQQQSAKAELELIEGYNTLQQKNYVQQAWQFSGGFWNYYTLSLPPIGLYTFGKLKPDPVSLGLYNTKYIISPYQLEENFLILEKQISNYFIYKNNLFQPRAYFVDDKGQVVTEARILKYTPNHIRVNTSANPTSRLVLAEVYSQGWRAYLDGVDEVPVQETPNALRLINIKPDTKFADFKYQPQSYLAGRVITGGTILFLAGLWIRKKRF